VKYIIFDKTGTLTVGKPVVVDTKLFNRIDHAYFYSLVKAAEVSKRTQRKAKTW
jgi:Cu+-exporting ATPase